MRGILAALLCVAAWPALAVEVDGRIDPAEWQGAEHITDFRLVEPLTGQPLPYATEAWVLATPEGLAIGFRNVQPANVPRTRQRTQRDEDAQVDRVNLMVDYDGDGRAGYNFTISLTDGIIDATISDESNFSKDWDGNWQHAVSEDAESWSVEMLIPWYIAPMRKGVDGKRTVGIYLDRVVGSTGERVAWPQLSFGRPRFLSDFSKLTLTAYSQSLLAVTPYVSGVYDNVGEDSGFKTGADIFWKPNGQTQLTATLNPDFGQVESDSLVVNFGAQETFFSDKRPFFTENQSIFDFNLLLDNSQLIYTRRVGGRADDGNGVAEINAAAKLNGSLGATNYGVLLAQEKGDAGRTFGALRLNHDFGTQTVGMLATRVEHPFLDREASVLGIDYRWQPIEQLNIFANVVGSDISETGTTTRGYGGTFLADYEMNDVWQQQWLLMHFDDTLDINDFGFLGRNNLNYAHWQVTRRINDLPESSPYASHTWRYRISGIDNDDGLSLQRQLRINRQSSRRDGGRVYAQVNVNASGYEDELTRGNGVFRLPPRANLYWERESPRKGNWAWEVHVRGGGGGLSGNDRIGYEGYFEPTYFISDALSVFAGLSYESTPDWLVWQHDNLVGSFEESSVQLQAGLEWVIGERQELRVKLEAISLDAKARQAYLVIDGGAVPSHDPIDDFSVQTLGFQIRYRYELAPLSNLYVVYGRGGYQQDNQVGDVFPQLGDSFSLRDSEQLLVKLSYRFEL